MTDDLPPSKFGAGTTYGSAGQPQAAPLPSAAPPMGYQNGNPYATNGSAYQAPPAVADPFAATAYGQAPTPPVVGNVAAQAITPPYSAPPTARYPAPAASPFGAGASFGTFMNAGKGAPMTAAVVSIVGGLWAAFTIMQMWKLVKGLFKMSKYASHLPGSASAWYYLTMAATIAEIVAIPLLLFGGYLLIQRNPLSRKVITYGSAAVIGANLFLAIGVNKVATAATNAMNRVNGAVDKVTSSLGINPSKTHRITDTITTAVTDRISSVSTEFIVFHLLLPGILAVIGLILVRSIATKLWVQTTPGYGVPPTY